MRLKQLYCLFPQTLIASRRRRHHIVKATKRSPGRRFTITWRSMLATALRLALAVLDCVWFAGEGIPRRGEPSGCPSRQQRPP